MSIESRLTKLETTANGNGATADPYLHVCRVMASGAVQMRKMNGEIEYVSRDEFMAISERYGRFAPFIVMDK